MTETIPQIMKQHGQRFTSQKKEVLCALQQKPQTVLEIFTSVRSKKKSIDKVTIYRILVHFRELGIVNEIHLGDREIRYELKHDKHHHHLVCENCGSIDDVLLREDILLSEVQKQSSFKVKKHTLEFFGLCKNCQ